MDRYQAQIWYERAIFYGHKGDRVNAERALAIARQYDPSIPPLPKFRNHRQLRTLERACLFSAFLIFCWFVYLLLLSPLAITDGDFPWRFHFLQGERLETPASKQMYDGITSADDSILWASSEATPPRPTPEYQSTTKDIAPKFSSTGTSPQAGNNEGNSSRGQLNAPLGSSPILEFGKPGESFSTPTAPTGSSNPEATQLISPVSTNPRVDTSTPAFETLQKIEPFVLLQNALYCFVRDQGRFPNNLNDLVRAKYITAIPRDPMMGSNKVSSSFTYKGGWVYLKPTITAPHRIREQIEMALYINHPRSPLFPFQPLSLKVSAEPPALTLMSGNQPLKSWPISTGSPETPTPTGNYLLVAKTVLANGNTNPYGSRWMKLGEKYPFILTPLGKIRKPEPSDPFAARGIGIHGTNEPTSIGTPVTNGCIRMNNADIEELYRLVPNGVEVLVGEEV